MNQAPSTPPATTPRKSNVYHASNQVLNVWTALQSVVVVAVISATLFTLWTPANLFSNQLLDRMLAGIQTYTTPTSNAPTVTPLPRPRIGIVAGHSGNDSGATCADGLTEVSVNLKIATLVQQNLINQGFNVDLLQEKDPRLFQYQALALVSIHNDSCDYINDGATGFKVAASLSNPHPEKAAHLLACLVQRYEADTNLHFHAGSITPDMTDYHSFSEINTVTTAAIIETGFLNLDRQFLTEHTDKVAKGISDGILCYIRNENTAAGQVTPTP
jgi:N-acetylmuramoyl-L-alanine amidase